MYHHNTNYILYNKGKNYKHDDPSIAYRGEEGRIMIDELPKVLFLNNQDPSKVKNSIRKIYIYINYNSIIYYFGLRISISSHKN